MSEIAFSEFSSAGVNTFVETGTFKGDLTADAAEYFTDVYTIEKSAPYAEMAAKRFEDTPNVTVIQGDSADELSALGAELTGDELYYLDAHYSDFSNEDEVAGINDQCPLLDELAALAAADIDGRIMIDDEFMFTKPVDEPYNPADWPSLDEVVSGIGEINSDVQMRIVGSYIIALPQQEEALIADIQRARTKAFNQLSKSAQLDCMMDTVAELGPVNPLRYTSDQYE